MVHILAAFLMALGVEASPYMQEKGYLRAAEENSMRVERFLMEGDKNWNRDRHCDWVILRPNPNIGLKGDNDPGACYKLVVLVGTFLFSRLQSLQ